MDRRAVRKQMQEKKDSPRWEPASTGFETQHRVWETDESAQATARRIAYYFMNTVRGRPKAALRETLQHMQAIGMLRRWRVNECILYHPQHIQVDLWPTTGVERITCEMRTA